jgi:Fe2+ or Zn2+ uptake regulation protein
VASLQALHANNLHGFVLTGVEIVFQGLCPSCVAVAAPA